ncbi:MAG: hypothetical protein AAGN35_24910 [Bacteroidota bacterium]
MRLLHFFIEKCRARAGNLLVALGLLIAGCAEDTCTPATCLMGSCVDGNCVCDAGAEGVNCTQESRLRVLGEWEVGDICRQNSTVYNVSITAGADPNAVTIDNLNQQDIPVSAVVDGLSFTIPDQILGQQTIQGAGGLDTTAQIISLEYRIDPGGSNEVVCQAAFRR